MTVGTVSRVMSSEGRRLPDHYSRRLSYGELVLSRRPVIYLRFLSYDMNPYAVYPPTMDEQPLNAGILDLATHKTCGTTYRYVVRWALTPPFHPCPIIDTRISGGCFLSRCLCRRRQLPVRECGALRCPDFPQSFETPKGSRRPRRAVPLSFSRQI